MALNLSKKCAFLQVLRATLPELSRAVRLIAGVGMLTAACVRETESQPSTAPEVRAHLEEILTLAEAHAIHREQIDWVFLREAVWSAAEGTGALADADSAVLVILEALRDGHSFYYRAAAQAPHPLANLLPSEVQGSDRPRRLSVATPCARLPIATPTLPADIGYVRIPGSSMEPQHEAETLQEQIQASDRPGLVGWIVDLRGNHGGNLWSMLAGIGPILGDGVAGYFVEPDGSREGWGYTDRSAWIEGNQVITVERAHNLEQPSPRVAVLIDQGTVSSGEAMAIAFRGRPGARLFGNRTCGRATANRPFKLSNGATLFLTVAWLADRRGTIYEVEIQPDERASGAAAVGAAVQWLREKQ